MHTFALVSSPAQSHDDIVLCAELLAEYSPEVGWILHAEPAVSNNRKPTVLTGFCRRVEVRHVCPGNSEPEQCDYWWSQEHDRRFMTFIDKYPEGSQPEFLPHLAAPYRVRAVAQN